MGFFKKVGDKLQSEAKSWYEDKKQERQAEKDDYKKEKLKIAREKGKAKADLARKKGQERARRRVDFSKFDTGGKIL